MLKFKKPVHLYIKKNKRIQIRITDYPTIKGKNKYNPENVRQEKNF